MFLSSWSKTNKQTNEKIHDDFISVPVYDRDTILIKPYYDLCSYAYSVILCYNNVHYIIQKKKKK